MSKSKMILALVAAVAVFLAAGSALAGAEFKVPGSAEGSFIKIGFLVQGQAEVTNARPVSGEGDYYNDETNQNLFLRRVRLLVGGNITPKLSYFIETDSPNIGKYINAGAGAGAKNAGNMYIQDVIVTYSFADEFKLEGGMLLTANSHQSLTSAAGLLGIDYGPWAFAYSGALDNRVGRDYGVQARGYLFDKHLEYRAGVFQGNRNFDSGDGNANEPFRYIGRVVFYAFEPETSYFYTGATMGKKKILAIGGGIDIQESYVSYSGDLFWDQPIGNGDAFTLQADYNWIDGEETFDGNRGTINLPGQSTYFFETQYFISAAKLGIWGQYAINDYQGWNPPGAAFKDQTRTVVGIAYWADNHNLNVKLGWGQHEVENGTDTTMWTLQTQIFDY